ncbi:hypothetical protein PM082_004046 [Marasmius tenuissimus]|nr:hypothetical protein PM082_004046 [Marasmius tenuissimus]
MPERLSTTNDPQLSDVIQTIQETSSNSSENEWLRSVATTTLNIWKFSDVPKFKLLCETSCDTAYSAIYYTGKETESSSEVSPATQTKLDELNRVLEEVLIFCRSVRSRNWLIAIVLWAVGSRDKKKIKEFRIRLKTIITKDFVPEDWKPLSIRDRVESAIRRARESEATPADPDF